MRFRTIGLALAIAAVAAFAAVPAFAADNDEVGVVDGTSLPSHGVNPDPQTTNIPYLGWLGNRLTVAKCLRFNDDSMTDAQISQLGASLSVSLDGTFTREDWTGVLESEAVPTWRTGLRGDRSTTVHPSFSRAGLCWSADISSNKPGLSVIKLDVSLEVLASIEFTFGRLLVDVGPISVFHQILLSHQFLAIWMKASAPVINEVGPAQPGGNLEQGDLVGDPAGANGNGTGVFQPQYKPLSKYGAGSLSDVFGVVKSVVKGTFPTGNDFAGKFPGDLVTLPDQWSDLAHALAIDDTTALGSRPGSAFMRWDIHDNNTPHALGVDPDPFHSTLASCNTGTAVGIDAVDNCRRGDEDGPFSRVNGATWPTIGPFDALFPDQTLLNDGALDSYDTPMPPLRVDFSLSAKSIGAFAKADKDDVYDSDNTRDTRHDLYAPFYKAYIPAAGLLGRWGGSGVAGAFANNYVGFINDGQYDYWNIYPQAERDGNNNCKDPQGNPYPLPTGPSQVSVYTDEHGEAFVKFLPYVGNYLTNDSQYRCNVKPGLYGEADITAEGFYPDQQPLWTTPGTSNTVHKIANQLADKKLECIKKPLTESEAFCVETVTDFNGDPMPGVEVRFATSGNNGQLEAGSTDLIPPYNTIGQGIGDKDPSGRWIELTTNSKGQVGVDVLSSDACVDVTSQNLLTRWNDWDKSGIIGAPVSLTYHVNPATGAACGSSSENPTAIVGLGTGTTPVVTPPVVTPPVVTNPPAGGGGTPAAGVAGTSTAAAIVSLGGPVVQASPVLSAGQSAVVAQVSARLFSVKVLQTQLGRFLVVNVKGSAKTAKIRIQIMGKNGKVLRTLVRTVPTNRAFKIANFKLAKTAAAVKATVTA